MLSIICRERLSTFLCLILRFRSWYCYYADCSMKRKWKLRASHYQRNIDSFPVSLYSSVLWRKRSNGPCSFVLVYVERRLLDDWISLYIENHLPQETPIWESVPLYGNDGNDLTYFISFNLHVMSEAYESLKLYIKTNCRNSIKLPILLKSRRSTNVRPLYWRSYPTSRRVS